MSALMVELEEWGKRDVPGAALSSLDRAFVDKLQGQDGGRIVIDELRDGLRICSRAWVGVVCLENLEIRIVPKLAGENLGLVEMLEFTYGLDGLRRLQSDRTIETEGSNLLDLVALLLAEACEGLLKYGLLADYTEWEEDLSYVRGRLLGDRQILRRFGQIDRIECRFDEHQQDIDENRLLSFALNLCSRRVTSEFVKQRIRRLKAIFDAVCDSARLNPRVCRTRLVYHRLNEHYREPHALAWLILDSIGVQDVLEIGKTSCFAFLIDMNALFERFVLRVIEVLTRGQGIRVRYQHSDRSIIWDAVANRPYARVIPDLLLDRQGGSGARLAIDAKYKTYDERKVASDDIYQSFLYAYAYGGESGKLRPALLLYPATEEASAPLRLRIRDRQGEAAEIVAMGIRIPSLLRECAHRAAGSSSTELLREVETMLPGETKVLGRPLMGTQSSFHSGVDEL